MEKPTKIAYPYDSWRGTTAQLVEIARAVQDEIERAVEAAKRNLDEEIDKQHVEWLAQNERDIRGKFILPPSVSLSPAAQAERAQAILIAENYKIQRKQGNLDLVRGATRLTFGYTDRSGRRLTSKDPTFMEKATNPNGILMQGSVYSSPTATITLTLQNKPWEWLTLEVEGEDPDWVSSAATPLHQALTARESRVTKFFRNQWVKGIFALVIWGLFIPPIAVLLERLGIDRLIAVVVAVIPVGVVSNLYQFLTRPVLITSSAPSAWLEVGKVAISAGVTYAIRFGLDRLAERVMPPR